MIKAIKDRIFIRLDKSDNKTAGGLLLLEDETHPPSIGTVESIGNEVTSVAVGDKVLFHIFDDLPSHDKEVVVVRENSILGVFEND